MFILRKKSNINTNVANTTQPSQRPPLPSSQSSGSAVTPLYERFATKGTVDLSTSSKPSKSISRPMTLGRPGAGLGAQERDAEVSRVSQNPNQRVAREKVQETRIEQQEYHHGQRSGPVPQLPPAARPPARERMHPPSSARFRDPTLQSSGQPYQTPVDSFEPPPTVSYQVRVSSLVHEQERGTDRRAKSSLDLNGARERSESREREKWTQQGERAGSTTHLASPPSLQTISMHSTQHLRHRDVPAGKVSSFPQNEPPSPYVGSRLSLTVNDKPLPPQLSTSPPADGISGVTQPSWKTTPAVPVAQASTRGDTKAESGPDRRPSPPKGFSSLPLSPPTSPQQSREVPLWETSLPAVPLRADSIPSDNVKQRSRLPTPPSPPPGNTRCPLPLPTPVISESHPPVPTKPPPSTPTSKPNHLAETTTSRSKAEMRPSPSLLTPKFSGPSPRVHRKYSPLAAFGLRDPQRAASTTPSTPSQQPNPTPISQRHDKETPAPLSQSSNMAQSDNSGSGGSEKVVVHKNDVARPGNASHIGSSLKPATKEEPSSASPNLGTGLLLPEVSKSDKASPSVTLQNDVHAQSTYEPAKPSTSFKQPALNIDAPQQDSTRPSTTPSKIPTAIPPPIPLETSHSRTPVASTPKHRDHRQGSQQRMGNRVQTMTPPDSEREVESHDSVSTVSREDGLDSHKYPQSITPPRSIDERGQFNDDQPSAARSTPTQALHPPPPRSKARGTPVPGRPLIFASAPDVPEDAAPYVDSNNHRTSQHTLRPDSEIMNSPLRNGFSDNSKTLRTNNGYPTPEEPVHQRPLELTQREFDPTVRSSAVYSSGVTPRTSNAKLGDGAHRISMTDPVLDSKPSKSDASPKRVLSALTLPSNRRPSVPKPPSPPSRGSSSGSDSPPRSSSHVRPLPRPPSSQGPRKLQKTPPQNAADAPPLGSPIDLGTGQWMAPDADPFAKDEVVQPLSHVSTRSPSHDEVHEQPRTSMSVEHNANGKLEQTSRQIGEQKSPVTPPTPVSPDQTSPPRSRKRAERHTKPPQSVLEAMTAAAQHHSEPVVEVEPVQEPAEPVEPSFYPLERHLTNPALFAHLLTYFTFHDWCVMTEVNDALRRLIEHRRELRELVLERFLATVGYTRWKWGKNEPLLLTFRDLNSYMRGVSVPAHQYAVSAQIWIDSKLQGVNDKSASVTKTLLASSCRAYTRVVLRLRAQAEAEAAAKAAERANRRTPPPSSSTVNLTHSRPPTSYTSSRPPSPASSSGHNTVYSHHRRESDLSRSSHSGLRRASPVRATSQFRSPLFRVGHAPLLRVFVPSVEGVWLSDASVLDCEKELKRASALSLLRVGDVVWDTAVGDEENVGRMVWDGNYLIDLDYTYSRSGDLPPYIYTLAFPPSYFHRVIRTSSNPICYIDISPWSEEIAANLQLLQDRVKTETPQGTHHTVVRWIHRTSFKIRPAPHRNSPIPIPGANNLNIDPSWYGTVVVETEGTNEGLADLQDRCKPAFPVRAGVDPNKAGSRVFRLMRERSRPAEIWIRIVHDKERMV